MSGQVSYTKLFSLTVCTAKHLEPLKGGKLAMEILVRSKDPDQNAKHFQRCLDAIKAAGEKVGLLAKDSALGPFAEEWRKAFGDVSKEVEEVDIAPALSTVFSVKDENELRSIRSAAKANSLLLVDYFIDEMSEILDAEKKVTHKALADKIDRKLDSNFFQENRLKLTKDFSVDQLDWCYGPVIQSGGNYDLRLNAVPDDGNLHAGTIIAGLGLRHKSYCAMLARTYLVDPNKSQESNYKLLLAVHEAVIAAARDGALVKDLWNKAIGIIRSKKPELEKNFLKSVGWGIGIETRDANNLINSKNTRSLQDGVTLCITTGFNDIQNPQPQDKTSKTYSLFLADTIRISGKPGEGSDGSPKVFTRDAPSDLEGTSFFFKDEEEDVKESPKAKTKKDSKVGAVASSNITKTKLRAERTTQIDEGAEARRRQHQKELALKKQQEGMERYSEATDGANGEVQKKFKRFESYKRDNQLPSRVKDLVIVVDQKAATVVLPIMGRPVPFHVNTIKNASHTDEGDFTYLRINFLSPGQGVGRKDDQPFEDPTAHFVRSLTFRSKDQARMQEVANQITELRKNMVKREQEKKEMEDVVEQEKLTEIRSKSDKRPTGLKADYSRPQTPETRKYLRPTRNGRQAYTWRGGDPSKWSALPRPSG